MVTDYSDDLGGSDATPAPGDGGEPRALPPPPSTPAVPDTLLVEVDSSQDDAVALGSAVDEGLPPPRVVSDGLTPREVPAQRPVEFVQVPTGAHRRYWIGAALASVLAVSAAVTVRHLASVQRAPIEDAIGTGRARLNCKYGVVDKYVRRLSTLYSCTFGGELRCDHALGCAVWTWEHDESLQSWTLLERGHPLPVDDLYRNVAPALRGVASVAGPRP